MDNMGAKPFVKWVGGKTQLLSEVKNSLPQNLSTMQNLTYVEPFVGGGAVLFWILQEYPNIQNAVINDINSELICTYQVIKSSVYELITRLSDIQQEYISLNQEERKKYFLLKRATFNTKTLDKIETAAIFIFLNRTCFNGLYRVNSKGEFNVPHGKYSNPKICDSENLIAVSDLLQKVTITCGDFSQTAIFATPNSIFYFDPPYKPITATSSFTSYTVNGFDDNEQIRLRDFCEHISERGAYFIASNSDPMEKTGVSFFDEIYNRFNIKRVYATRQINANPNGRGELSEIMISNIVSV